MGLFKGLNQVNLRVKDIKSAVKWYTEVLGLEVKYDYETTVVLSFSGGEEAEVCLIELGDNEALPENAESGTYPVFAISPEQAETCHNELKRKGVSVEEGKPAHFKFKDPDGNLLEAYLPGLYTEEQFKHLR